MKLPRARRWCRNSLVKPRMYQREWRNVNKHQKLWSISIDHPSLQLDTECFSLQIILRFRRSEVGKGINRQIPHFCSINEGMFPLPVLLKFNINILDPFSDRMPADRMPASRQHDFSSEDLSPPKVHHEQEDEEYDPEEPIARITAAEDQVPGNTTKKKEEEKERRRNRRRRHRFIRGNRVDKN